MLTTKKIESLGQVATLKKQYFALSTAALDGMWHIGFASQATHFGFYENNILVGYCCINSEGYMLQFYLSPTAKTEVMPLFFSIAQQTNTVIGKLNGAFVSTAEPDYLSLCFDNSSSFNVNALMYQYNNTSQAHVTLNHYTPVLTMSLAIPEQLDDFVEFSVTNIGAPAEWLTQYYTHLIKREELFGYWNGSQLLVSGECRLFDDYQTEYAELGMIVALSERGKGLATKALQYLSGNAIKRGLQPICSTESANIGAQKAISRAGFSSTNRIIQFKFKAT